MCSIPDGGCELVETCMACDPSMSAEAEEEEEAARARASDLADEGEGDGALTEEDAAMQICRLRS